MIKTKSRIIKILFIVFLSLMMMTGGIVFLCNESATPPSEMEEQVDEVKAATNNNYVSWTSYGANGQIGANFGGYVWSGYEGAQNYRGGFGKTSTQSTGTDSISLTRILGQSNRGIVFNTAFTNYKTGLLAGYVRISSGGSQYAYVSMSSVNGTSAERGAINYQSDLTWDVALYYTIKYSINWSLYPDNYNGYHYDENSFSYRYDTASSSGKWWWSVDGATETGTPVLPTRSGYTFKGFYTGTSGSGTQIINANMTWTNAWNASTAYYTTLYAYWAANSYTVTANANGGSIQLTSGWTGTGSTATKSLKYGSAYGTLPTVRRTGYTFAGWYTSATGGTKIETTTTVNTASAHTIYAHWTRNTYLVEVNPNGGAIYKNLVPTSGIADNWTTTGNNMTLTYTASQGVYTLTPANASDPFSNLNYTVNLPVGSYVMNAVVTDASGNRLTGSQLQVFYGISYAYSEAQSMRFGATTRVTFSVTTAGNYNFRFDNDYGSNAMKVKQFWIASTTKETSTVRYYVPYLTYYQLPTDDPTNGPKGKTFAGWSNSSSLKVYDDGVIYNSSAGAVSRTATWTDTQYNFTINANGGQVDKNWLYGPQYKDGVRESFRTLQTIYNWGVLEFYSTMSYDFFDCSYEESGTFLFKIPNEERGSEDGYRLVYTTSGEQGARYSEYYIGVYGFNMDGDELATNEMALMTYPWDTVNEDGVIEFGSFADDGITYKYYYFVATSDEAAAQEGMYIEYPQIYDNFTPLMESYSIPLGYLYGYTLPIPTRTGYTFTGWTFSSQPEKVIQADSNSNLYTIIMSTSDVVATAQWRANSYNVTWNGNNATLNSNLWNYAGSTGYRSSNTGSNSSYTFSSKNATSSVTYDSTISYNAPIPLRIGYTFNGWWSATSGGVQVAGTNGKLVANVSGWTNSSSQWVRASASTLYAQWTKNSYTISYNLNGGTASSTAPTSYNYGTSAAVGNPTRTGYTFAGWTVTATLSGKAYATINLSNGTMQYDSSYPNAVYFPLFYQAANVAYSGKVSDQNSEIRWRQYTTAGAYSGSASGTSSTACYTSLWYHGGMNSTTTTISWTQGTSYTIPATQVGNLTLVARWNVKSYTLTANANSGSIPATTGWTGSGATATKSVAYDTAYGTLPSPTRTGYGFAGWYTAASGGTQVSASTKMGAGNKTIYAHWSINSYTLTANCNGGSAPSTLPSGWTANGTMPQRSVKYNSGYGTLPEPTRQGYIFAGWWTQASGGSEVNSGTSMGAADTTIYAHWVESWVKYMSDDDPVIDQADGYYKIDSAAKLARLAYLVNYNIDNGKWANYQYKQTADIDLSAHYWQPIGIEGQVFGGTFDGKTFDIKNLTIETINTDRYNSNSNIGLFGFVDSAQIDNVNVYNCGIKARQQVGGIAGYSLDAYFKNCRVSGLIQTLSYGDVGGIAGYITGDSEIRECESNAKVDAGDGGNAGGIVGNGYSGSRIIDCVNIGNISGSDQIGGIVGCVDSMTITSCVNNGYVYSNYDAGGIAGYAMSSVVLSNCVNTGVIEGLGRVGGATSCTEGTVTIEYFVNTGNLINKNGDEGCGIGGILGYAEGTVTIASSFVDCEISSGSTNLVGAFIGEDYDGATIQYCGARIKIVTATSNLAPFVKSSGICNDSYSLINNGGTQVNRITATSSGMDGKFGMVSSIHDGLPVPLGIYHVSQYGTTTGIASTLKGSKYGCTTA